MTIFQQYLDAWIRYQRAKSDLDALKVNVVKKLHVAESKEVDDYRITIRERPVFTNVTLETARKFDAVKKVVNTTVLNEYLKKGYAIKGATKTAYVSVSPIA